MADIDRRRGKWHARWRDPEGRQHSRSFDHKRDAEAFLAATLADMARGAYTDPTAGRLTVREYAEKRWLAAQLHLRPNSAATYASHVATHIVPLLGIGSSAASAAPTPRRSSPRSARAWPRRPWPRSTRCCAASCRPPSTTA
jgi:hypothetical protein